MKKQSFYKQVPEIKNNHTNKDLEDHCTKVLLPDGAYSKSVETVQSQRSASHRTRKEGWKT